MPTLTPTFYQSLRIRPDDMVNSVAISDDASAIVGATWYHNYSRSPGPDPIGSYAVYLADASGNVINLDTIPNCFSGVYSVAISPKGNVAAAAGWLSNPAGPGGMGLLRAYETNTQNPIGFANDPATGKAGNLSIRDRVNSVSLSGDGSVLAAAADRLYVYFRTSSGTYSAPQIVAAPLVNPVNAVAVHPSGEWLVCCDRGHVCVVPLALASNALGTLATFNAPNVNFRSIAVARGASTFVACGGVKGVSEFVYDFSLASMSQTVPAPRAISGQIGNSVRWIAVSSDGTQVAVVSNNGTAGLLVRLDATGSALNVNWQANLHFKPNGVSLSGDGSIIGAADGYDSDQPGGTFYLFKGDGTAIGELQTTLMNWPIAVSANAKGVAAGSDDGNLYFFS